MTIIADIARAVESAGFPFLTWADWFPGGHPDALWTKKVTQVYPATRHWVHHSVTSATQPPVAAARAINDIGIARFGKMSYPFLIHSSGAVIQGCYPYIGAHTKNFNSSSLAGCNIGNYDTLVPPTRMVAANAALINALAFTGHFPYPGYTVAIYGHRQSPFASTACPGRYLFARIPEIADLVGPPVPAPPPIPTPPPVPEEPTVPTLYKRVSVAGQALFYDGGKLMEAHDEEFQPVGANVAIVGLKEEGWKRVIKHLGPVLT